MTASPAPTALSPLRPYQRKVAAAILRSVVAGSRGMSFSVQMPRQAGKNETSARVEASALVWCLATRRGLTGVKCAPTWVPQAVNSMRRLSDRLRDMGVAEASEEEGGYVVHVGRSRLVFLSAAPEANVVGETASLFLEVDEAQDVEVEKFDKEFRPMVASTAAPVVFWGTPWDDASLLERAKQQHLEQERRDGIRRHFEVSWQEVAASSPEYRVHVEGELARLGADHPLFLTQYGMQTLPGQGRLFSRQDAALWAGAHGRLEAPVAGEIYVASVDIGGSDLMGTPGHDSTVLTVGRVRTLPGVGDEPRQAVELVLQLAWTGRPSAEVWGAVLVVVRRFGCVRLVVDATGIGEPAGEYFVAALGARRCRPLKFTAASKSGLGYGLLAAVRGGRLQLHADDGTPDHRELIEQLTLARVEYLPSRLMRFYVAEEDGHDDRLIGLALLVEAAVDVVPRVARGSVRDG